MTDRMLSPKEAAAYLQLSESWLTKWRMRGAGPSYVKLNDSQRGRIRYPESALKAWIQTRLKGGLHD